MKQAMLWLLEEGFPAFSSNQSMYATHLTRNNYSLLSALILTCIITAALTSGLFILSSAGADLLLSLGPMATDFTTDLLLCLLRLFPPATAAICQIRRV